MWCVGVGSAGNWHVAQTHNPEADGTISSLFHYMCVDQCSQFGETIIYSAISNDSKYTPQGIPLIKSYVPYKLLTDGE